MRRALIVLFATIAGVVLVLSFHTSAEPTKLTSPSSNGGPVTTSGAGAAGASPPTSGSGSAGVGKLTPTTTASVRTLTGTLEQNRYGPVQVRVTVRGTSLVDITALQMPSDRAHSQLLSAEAGPILRSEALQAQSAHINVVSGATFTSDSYAQSLQSTLDQAGIGG